MRHSVLMLAGIVTLLAACNDDDIKPAPVVEEPLLLSYESTSGNFKVTADYEYDMEDHVKKISWERTNPGITRGTDVFIYDEEGKLKEQIRSITGLVDETTKFTYDDDKVFASATYSNGNKIGFAFYDYNDKDQLERVEFYTNVGPGFLRTDSIGFMYHPDGNLFKMFKYTFDYNEERLMLVSTEIFSEYLQSPNPLATVEILPVVNLQKTLPKEYVVANEGGTSNTYEMQYDLRPDGYPRERIVTSAGTAERTVYTYNR